MLLRHDLVAMGEVPLDGGRRADLIASDLQDLNAQGEGGETLRVDDLAQWRNASDWAAQRPYVVGAAQAFTRRLFTQFGPYLPNVVYEDQINTLRALLMGGALTIAEPLVQYRRGGASAGLAATDAAPFYPRHGPAINAKSPRLNRCCRTPLRWVKRPSSAAHSNSRSIGLHY
jgi:hypothetical protein